MSKQPKRSAAKCAEDLNRKLTLKNLELQEEIERLKILLLNTEEASVSRNVVLRERIQV